VAARAAELQQRIGHRSSIVDGASSGRTVSSAAVPMRPSSEPPGRTAAGAEPWNPPVDLDEKASQPPGTPPLGLRPTPATFDGQPDLASTRPDPDEQAIVQRARDGDADAFRQLVERTQDRTYRLAMRLLRCDPA